MTQDYNLLAVWPFDSDDETAIGEAMELGNECSLENQRLIFDETHPMNQYFVKCHGFKLFKELTRFNGIMIS